MFTPQRSFDRQGPTPSYQRPNIRQWDEKELAQIEDDLRQFECHEDFGDRATDHQSFIPDVDVNMPDMKHDEETHNLHGSDWQKHDATKSGCDLLRRIIQAFQSVSWNVFEACAPFTDVVSLCLCLLFKFVSEELMDLILDILRLWQKEEVDLTDVQLANNAKQLKRLKESCLPDLSQFIGLSFSCLFWLRNVSRTFCRTSRSSCKSRISCWNILLCVSFCIDCHAVFDTSCIGTARVSSGASKLAKRFHLHNKLGTEMEPLDCSWRLGSHT